MSPELVHETLPGSFSYPEGTELQTWKAGNLN